MPNEELLSKLNRITKSFKRAPDSMGDFQFFYIDKSYSYSLKDMKLHIEYSQHDFYGIRTLTVDRGKILSIFSKLEFLMNECLRVYFFGLGKTEEFEKLIEHVGFRHRVKCLQNYQVIPLSVSKKIGNVAFVRNQIAHMWRIEEILYLEKYLMDSNVLKCFKKDFEEVFSSFIDGYHNLLEKSKFPEYLEQIISKSEITS
ncbi:MAG: hypothetical protein HAW67_06570 [Endozoicomonadaceae bacterium]|nr:hypothetical protein [Endozoicomonadaceae bacterium]